MSDTVATGVTVPIAFAEALAGVNHASQDLEDFCKDQINAHSRRQYVALAAQNAPLPALSRNLENALLHLVTASFHMFLASDHINATSTNNAFGTLRHACPGFFFAMTTTPLNFVWDSVPSQPSRGSFADYGWQMHLLCLDFSGGNESDLRPWLQAVALVETMWLKNFPAETMFRNAYEPQGQVTLGLKNAVHAWARLERTELVVRGEGNTTRIADKLEQLGKNIWGDERWSAQCARVIGEGEFLEDG
ncbi:hypothetical protein LTS18_009128 [Coniosporium uncinatum]|uniref:Uncharacterized protein n=1 Tax=Coniosporium uncinatum TaxID=93489 RepID=A0ACC3DA74_9PEZI|nr:hypothetical protein LTS18_009128 [Coniosporium uncinatum]